MRAMRVRLPYAFFGFPLMSLVSGAYCVVLFSQGAVRESKLCAIVAALAVAAWICLFVMTNGTMSGSPARHSRRAEDALMFIGGVFLVMLYLAIRGGT